MDANDHLRWMIGDMAVQIAVLNAKVEALEAKLPPIVKLQPKEAK